MADNSKNTDNKIENVFGLWKGRGKVVYQGWVKEDVNIPAGAKVLVFENSTATPENRRPVFDVCFVLENDE